MFVLRQWTPSWSSPSSRAPLASSSSTKSSKRLACARSGSSAYSIQTRKVTSHGLNSTRRWVVFFLRLCLFVCQCVDMMTLVNLVAWRSFVVFCILSSWLVYFPPLSWLMPLSTRSTSGFVGENISFIRSRFCTSRLWDLLRSETLRRRFRDCFSIAAQIVKNRFFLDTFQRRPSEMCEYPIGWWCHHSWHKEKKWRLAVRWMDERCYRGGMIDNSLFDEQSIFFFGMTRTHHLVHGDDHH